MYRVSISHCEITSQSEVRGNCDSRDTDEEFFYRGEVMVLALCQVWVNDVTAGGITSVTKSARSGAVRVPRSVISPIRKVEDRIVYVRDKRVGLSIINQFASTRQQLGNYIFSRIMKPFIVRFSTIASKDGVEKVDRAPVLRRKIVTA